MTPLFTGKHSFQLLLDFNSQRHKIYIYFCVIYSRNKFFNIHFPVFVNSNLIIFVWTCSKGIIPTAVLLIYGILSGKDLVLCQVSVIKSKKKTDGGVKFSIQTAFVFSAICSAKQGPSRLEVIKDWFISG